MTVHILGKPVVLLLAGLLLSLAGCAQLTTTGTSEEQVAQRAEARMNALLARDINKAYEFSSPGYRQQISPTMFRSRHAGIGSWVKGEVLNVSCPEEDVCDVNIAITYQAFMGQGRRPSEMGQGPAVNTRVFTERWLYVDDQWWFFESR